MNDFDRLLELDLRRMLDPVVASEPPIRRGKAKTTRRLVLAVDNSPLDLAGETVPVVEPVALAMPHLIS